jgi:myo-inositol-1(or 4)-monophosphatase
MRLAFTRGKGSGSFRKQVELMQRFCDVIGGSRSFGSVAWELAMTAQGALVGVVAVDLEPWDYAAGALLVEEAQGIATNLEGQRWTLQDRDLIAAPAHIHRELLKLLTQ